MRGQKSRVSALTAFRYIVGISVLCTRNIPGIHDLQGGQHMRQSLLFAQVAVQTEEDLSQRGSIRFHAALPAHLVVDG